MTKESEDRKPPKAAYSSELGLMWASADALLDPQVLLEASKDPIGEVVGFIYREVNQAACDYLGLSRDSLIGSRVGGAMLGVNSTLLPGYIRCLETGEPLTLNDLSYDNEILVGTSRYDLRATRAAPATISLTWRDVTERFDAAQRVLLAEQRFHLLMDIAAIGMCVADLEGRFETVNSAMCEYLGYDAATLKQLTWQNLTAPGYLEADVSNIAKMISGEIDAYRLTKQFIHSGGDLIWGDVSVGCLRKPNGDIDRFIAQIVDITAEVQAREQLARTDEENRGLAQRLQWQSDRLSTEMEAAAGYMASIMPTGLTGEVTVTSRYLPSRELGGDCFEYTWVDADHLLVYLIDVSGHGVEPALLSVSVHNMIRSGSLGRETMLAPETALTELNHLFQMDQQRDHYFTVWYGVYRASTRTLTYVNAGAPGALMFEPAVLSGINVTELPSTSQPVGMFEDTLFASRDYLVPSGCRMLIYSDGASEIELADGGQLSSADFMSMCTGVAGSSDGSLDDLVDELRARTLTGSFDDDCSLIQLTFN